MIALMTQINIFSDNTIIQRNHNNGTKWTAESVQCELNGVKVDSSLVEYESVYEPAN